MRSPMRRVLSREDLQAFVAGSSVYATGGGGIMPSDESFNKMISRINAFGSYPELISQDELSISDVAFSYGGAGGGIQYDVRAKYTLAPGSDPSYERWVRGFDQYAWIENQIREMDRRFPLAKWSVIPDSQWGSVAEKELENIIGAKPVALLLGEIGPNGLGLMMKSAEKKVPIVDGDIAGHRAVPEASISSLNLFEINPCPLVLSTPWGDVIRIDKVLSFQRLEDITRHLAISAGGQVNSVSAIAAENVKKAVVQGSISKTIEVGRVILENRSEEELLEKILRATGGALLFEGKVSAFMREPRDAFNWGEIRITGASEFSGHSISIWFKNENHVAWLDGSPLVTSPDLISVVDLSTGVGLSNAWNQEWSYGRDVAVVGIPAWKGWLCERGLQIFGPKHFGFDINYKPLTTIIGDSASRMIAPRG